MWIGRCCCGLLRGAKFCGAEGEWFGQVVYEQIYD